MSFPSTAIRTIILTRMGQHMVVMSTEGTLALIRQSLMDMLMAVMAVTTMKTMIPALPLTLTATT